MPRSTSISQPDGSIRVIAVQGQQVWVGPVHVGVLSARVGTLPDGGEGLRAKLQLATPSGVEVRVLLPGDHLEFDGLGSLDVVGITPPEPADGPRPDHGGGSRGIVGLEFRPADQRRGSHLRRRPPPH